MHIKICSTAFDPWREIQTFQKDVPTMHGQYGATNIFIGTMRDFNQNVNVQSLSLEHYPGMTEKQLKKIVIEAQNKWSILDSLLIHRVGELYPNDPIVLVAVWAIHRGDAFDACRFIMEALKSKAPFWKKERLEQNQDRWVEKNTTGYLT